jgi:hypothetical protein
MESPDGGVDGSKHRGIGQPFDKIPMVIKGKAVYHLQLKPENKNEIMKRSILLAVIILARLIMVTIERQS